MKDEDFYIEEHSKIICEDLPGLAADSDITFLFNFYIKTDDK